MPPRTDDAPATGADPSASPWGEPAAEPPARQARQAGPAARPGRRPEGPAQPGGSGAGFGGGTDAAVAGSRADSGAARTGDAGGVPRDAYAARSRGAPATGAPLVAWETGPADRAGGRSARRVVQMVERTALVRVIPPTSGMVRFRSAVALVLIALIMGAAIASVLGVAVWGLATAIHHASSN